MATASSAIPSRTSTPRRQELRPGADLSAADRLRAGALGRGGYRRRPGGRRDGAARAARNRRLFGPIAPEAECAGAGAGGAAACCRRMRLRKAMLAQQGCGCAVCPALALARTAAAGLRRDRACGLRGTGSAPRLGLARLPLVSVLGLRRSCRGSSYYLLAVLAGADCARHRLAAAVDRRRPVAWPPDRGRCVAAGRARHRAPWRPACPGAERASCWQRGCAALGAHAEPARAIWRRWFVIGVGHGCRTL